MEYRKTPRIAAPEGRLDEVIDDATPRPRLRRFDFVTAPRHIDMTRVILAGFALLSIVAAGLYLGTHAFRSAIDLLRRQPQYQLGFHEIKLKHDPPVWFRGGAASFLKQVRATAGESEVLPLLELEKGRIERDFKVFPWVDDVRRIEYPPGGIEVDLVYKIPVAVIPFRRGAQIVVDAHGHVLPSEDIDPRTLTALVKIMGTPEVPLVPSVENPPGKAWKSGAAGALGARQDRAVLGAAKLAGFLDEPDRRQEAALLPALRIVTIIATDDRGLFVQNAEETTILWGDAPGDEAARRTECRGKMANFEKMGKKFQPTFVAFTRFLGVLRVGSIFMGAYRSANIAQERGSAGRIRFVTTAVRPPVVSGELTDWLSSSFQSGQRASRRRRD